MQLLEKQATVARAADEPLEQESTIGFFLFSLVCVTFSFFFCDAFVLVAAAAAEAIAGRPGRALRAFLSLEIPGLVEGGLRALRRQRRRARSYRQVHDGEAQRGTKEFLFDSMMMPILMRRKENPPCLSFFFSFFFRFHQKQTNKQTKNWNQKGRLLRLPLLHPRRALRRGRRRWVPPTRRRRPLPQPPPARRRRQGRARARARPRVRPLPRGVFVGLVRLRPPRVLRGEGSRALWGLFVRGRGVEGQLGSQGAGAGVREEEGGAVGGDEPGVPRERGEQE